MYRLESHLLFAYGLLFINITAFVVMGYDKAKAVKGGWRIRERHLLWLAAWAGAAGILAAMLLFRHKIRKPKFRWGVPVLLAAQLILYYGFIR